MSAMDQILGAQDAEQGPKVLIAAVHPETGRQVVNLWPAVIRPPLIELRCAGAGFPWHDQQGDRWTVEYREGVPFWRRASV